MLEKATFCAAIVAAAAAVTLAAPSSAEACGGFFCDSNQPVNQTAERIIFADHADDTVTAVVQIMYQGPSERFAWLLPVPGTPEVGVSSTAAFQRLQQATNPSYRVNTTVVGRCGQPLRDPSAGGGSGGADAGATADAAAGDSGVSVLDQGAVGPYDYVTISVAAGASDPAQEAVDWLTQNGYDLMATGPELIRPYLESGMNLIAFKLTKSAAAGDIRPVTLRYPAELPMIPIELTAVAAQPDMGVMVWVLGESRSVPSNYKSLVLNDALIDWFNPGRNYDDVVVRAANEAGGQGFVTEYADDSSTLDGVVVRQWEDSEWSQMNEPTQWDGRHGELLMGAMSSYGSWDGIRLAIEETVPVPAGVDPQDFLDCPSCYYSWSDTTITGFSPEAFLGALAEHVVDPMLATEALIGERPYVTRMYTTMSAEEMTLDPVFDFNGTLGDVSNQHVAQRTVYCAEHLMRSEAPWEATLPSGQTVRGVGRSWPTANATSMQANQLVVQHQSMGDGDVVENNTDAISGELSSHNDSVSLDPMDHGDPTQGGGDTGTRPDQDAGTGGDDFGGFNESPEGDAGGCNTASDATPAAPVALVLAALLGLGYRRRRRV